MRTSSAIIRLVMIQPWIQRTARNVIGGTAMRVGPIARRVAGIISGVGIEYPGGKDVHALAGKRAEDLLLASDGRPAAHLYELREGTFVLLVPAGITPAVITPAGITPAELQPAAPWADRVRVATPAGPGHPTMLVRPDGYIGWATDETNPPTPDHRGPYGAHGMVRPAGRTVVAPHRDARSQSARSERANWLIIHREA